ncbi:hypothetical protein GGH99_002515 [Coemansia sp. RSA 1285]|nr:hypothetical protein GGH99_002515 [Coemansia sp. RSA 1285]
MGTSDENAGKSATGESSYLDDRDYRLMTTAEQSLEEMSDTVVDVLADRVVAELEEKIDPLVQQVTADRDHAATLRTSTSISTRSRPAPTTRAGHQYPGLHDDGGTPLGQIRMRHSPRPMRNAEYPRTDARLATKYLAALDPAVPELVYAWIDSGGFVRGQNSIVRLFTFALAKEASYRAQTQRLRGGLGGRRRSSDGTQTPQSHQPRVTLRAAPRGTRHANPAAVRSRLFPPNSHTPPPECGDSEEDDDWFWCGE